MKQTETVSTRLKHCFYGLLSLGIFFIAIACKNSSQLASAPIHACDHLAADPEDPGRNSKVIGVRSETLMEEANILAAISVCTEAHEKYPDVPRFSYQLGRALAAAGMLEDAEPFLINAAESEYAAAFALLGDLSDEPEEAKDFYEIAAARGYGPAKRYLEQAAKTSAIREGNPLASTEAQASQVVENAPTVARASQSEHLQNASEPTEGEMLRAVKARFEAINDNYRDLKNSCERREFKNNPILAIQCLQLYGATGTGDIALQITQFEKLTCNQMGENYYWCEFIAQLSSSSPNVQAAFSQFMRGGSTGQGRFLRRGNGWIFLSMEE